MTAKNDEQERRKNSVLSDEQIESIKDRILASIYEDIGRSLVKKVLWALGVVLLALLAWLGGSGHLK